MILLVAPDDEVRALHEGALRAAGLVVDRAATTRAALASAQVGAPELVVVDRDLPDGDGWDVVRTLTAHAGERPIVVGVGRSRGRDDMESALVAGCDVFLEKPCDPDALVRTVRGMLGPSPRARVVS